VTFQLPSLLSRREPPRRDPRQALMRAGSQVSALTQRTGAEATRLARRGGARVAGDPLLIGVAGAALALGAAAIAVQALARRAEAENPPSGGFVDVDGVRLHYVERGKGEPLVLLHGNGALVDDFALSGLVQRAARRYRVFVFDRPGYGHSSRPRRRIWTPEAQADLFARAFAELGIERPIVLGHSWGTLVALALALEHRPAVKGLVLLSGYYFPTLRVDVPLAALPAIPGIGDLLRYTLSPLIARLSWRGMLRKLFGPNAVPEAFERFPVWMPLRPGQIRAAAAESALLLPAAARLGRRMGEVSVPVVIMAGEDDRLVASTQSERLHAELPDSMLRIVPGVGHMIHHIMPNEVLAAVDEAAALADAEAPPVRPKRRASAS
jgi:pimeloyl-ACP methyl ester carboxylesterase